MQSLNLVLFHWLGAGFDPQPRLLAFALLTSSLATWMIVAVVATLAWRRRPVRTDIFTILVCAGAVGMLSHAMAAWFDTPRPFMLGLSPDYARHSGRGGFPSTHACVMSAVAVYLAWRPRMRVAAGMVALLAIATGLARIYVGVHFPLDVLAGFVVGAVGGTAFAMSGVWIGRVLLQPWPKRWPRRHVSDADATIQKSR